jgi:hypothetical protein
MTLTALLIITGLFLALDVLLILVIVVGSSQQDRREGWDD